MSVIRRRKGFELRSVSNEDAGSGSMAEGGIRRKPCYDASASRWIADLEPVEKLGKQAEKSQFPSAAGNVKTGA
jgi:hypothetical protein